MVVRAWIVRPQGERWSLRSASPAVTSETTIVTAYADAPGADRIDHEQLEVGQVGDDRVASRSSPYATSSARRSARRHQVAAHATSTSDNPRPSTATGTPRTTEYAEAATVSQPPDGPQTAASPRSRTTREVAGDRRPDRSPAAGAAGRADREPARPDVDDVRAWRPADGRSSAGRPGTGRARRGGRRGAGLGQLGVDQRAPLGRGLEPDVLGAVEVDRRASS